MALKFNLDFRKWWRRVQPKDSSSEVQAVLVRDLGVTSEWFHICRFTRNFDKCKLLVLPERKSDQVELGIDGSQVLN